MLLDRAQRHEHALGDRLVRAPFGHQLEHLALARSQRIQRVVGSPAPEELADDGRVERRSALADAPHGRGELLQVGDAVLQEVADTFGALGEQIHCVRRLDVLREDEHAGLRVAARGSSRAATRPSSVWVGGMRMSTIATSGLCMATCRSRSSAVPDWATTSKPDSSSRRTTPSRSRTESSAITTLHRVAEHRDRVAQRREIAREAVCEELVDVLRLGQACEAMGAEVAHCESGAVEQRRRREQDLAAVTGRPDPRGAVDVDARVAVLGHDRLPVWMPMRTRTSRSSGPRVLDRAPAGASTAAATASLERLANAANISSPCASITVPSWSATASRKDPAHVGEDRRRMSAPARLDEAGRSLDVAEQEAEVGRGLWASLMAPVYE